MTKELPKRSEVRIEDTWKIEDIYASVADWEADVEKAKEQASELEARKGTLGSDAKTLCISLALRMELNERMEKANLYAELAFEVDTRNGEAHAREQRFSTLMTEMESRLAFFDPEALLIPQEKLESFFQEEPGLETYRHWFEELHRTEAHRLSPEMEGLLAMSGEVCQAPGEIYYMFENADVEFPEIENEDHEKVRITSGRFVSMQMSPDRRVRKDAFEGLYHTYQKFENTLAASYSGQVKQLMFHAKARKYANTLEAAVDENNVSPDVYANLLSVVNANLDKMHRYVGLRKRCLGLDELHMYDVYVPMVADADRKVPFEEAKETVLEALAPLGDRYVALLKEGFAGRWIDVYENQGKRGGAFSACAYGTHPYVLLNYDQKLDDMFTLAHEMGHSLHSYFSNEAQPFVYSRYRIFVAEVASTCNEVLLMEHLLARTQDKKERAYLLNHFLESYKSTLYRQTMFAEFEKETNAMAEAGEALTAEALCNAYYGLNRKYFGPEMVSDKEISWEWCRIPHFYYNFYVYQYATGFSAAVAIARKILREGQPAVDAYMKFLSGGCSKSPVELLKIAGVDMASKEPIQDALDLFGELLDEMDGLMS